MRFLKSLVLAMFPNFILWPLKAFHYKWILIKATEEDEKDLKLVKEIVTSGSIVMDIGANVGLYTKFPSNLCGKDGCVYSIEPILPTFEILKYNVSAFQLNNVKLLNYALYDKNSESLMEIPQ